MIFNLLVISFNFLNAQNIKGYWLGSLNVQGSKLHLIFHITEANNMDSPDQGAKVFQ